MPLGWESNTPFLFQCKSLNYTLVSIIHKTPSKLNRVNFFTFAPRPLFWSSKLLSSFSPENLGVSWPAIYPYLLSVFKFTIESFLTVVILPWTDHISTSSPCVPQSTYEWLQILPLLCLSLFPFLPTTTGPWKPKSGSCWPARLVQNASNSECYRERFNHNLVQEWWILHWTFHSISLS